MKRAALIVMAAALLACTIAGSAAAARPTFSDSCGSAYNTDPVVCERLDYLAAEAADDETRFDYAWWGCWFCAGLLVIRIIQPYWDRLFNWNRLPQ